MTRKKKKILGCQDEGGMRLNYMSSWEIGVFHCSDRKKLAFQETKKEEKRKTKGVVPLELEKKHVNLIRFSEAKNRITQFPKYLRFSIILYFYEVINKNEPVTNDKLIKKLIFTLENEERNFTKSEVNEFLKKWRDVKYSKYLKSYILNLARFVKRLKQISEYQEKIRSKTLQLYFLEDGLDLGLAKSSLKIFISEVIEMLNNQMEDFYLRISNSSLTYDDLLSLAESRSGQLLTTEKEFNSVEGYVSHTKFQWKCEDGHSFKLSPAAVNQGRWCPCKRRKKPLTYERLQKMARKRGFEKNGVPGKLLTSREEYDNLKKKQTPNKTKYKWSCEINDHDPWNSRPDSIQGGSWCPTCSHGTPLTYEDMVRAAREKGIASTGTPGRILTSREEIIKISNKSKTQFLWQCGEKHEPWQSTYSNIKMGRWCPYCAQGTSERIARYFFESIFREKFPKRAPRWLTHLTGRRLELDGYCEKLKLAFEFNGIQHYFPIYGVKKLKDQQENDYLKQWGCEKQEVVLIVIPYDFDGREDFMEYDKMQDFIIAEYERKTGNILAKMPLFDYRTRNIKRLDEF